MARRGAVKQGTYAVASKIPAAFLSFFYVRGGSWPGEAKPMKIKSPLICQFPLKSIELLKVRGQPMLSECWLETAVIVIVDSRD